MNIHQNARLTPLGRAAMISRIEVEGWSVARAAEAFGISRQTVGKWLQRHRRGGERRLHDRSSAPRRCPRRTSAEIVDQVQALRRQRMTGPAIARNLLLGWLCGGGFLVVKVIEYAAKFGAGISMSTNTFYMFYISLTFFHFMHVILGMVILTVLWVQARKGVYGSHDAHGLESGAAYWHMVDLLWIVLFPLVYVMR